MLLKDEKTLKKSQFKLYNPIFFLALGGIVMLLKDEKTLEKSLNSNCITIFFSSLAIANRLVLRKIRVSYLSRSFSRIMLPKFIDYAFIFIVKENYKINI